MIDIEPIWLWIIGTVLPIFSMFAFAYMFYMQRKVAPMVKFAQKMMKQWGSMMNEKKGEKREVRKLTEEQKSSRSKLVKAIKAKVPFGLLEKHNDAEVIALVQDQELMKGFIFLGQTGQKFLAKIVNVVSPSAKEKKRHGLATIPEIA